MQKISGTGGIKQGVITKGVIKSKTKEGSNSDMPREIKLGATKSEIEWGEGQRVVLQ